jgi:chemotaxis protein methyltransferase CheR
MDLTLEEFGLLRDLIYEKIGVFFEEKKMYFLKSRIANRIKETNSSSAKEYYRFLRYDNSDDEIKKLINLVTVNETYFFRDLKQINAFANKILPSLIEEKKKKNEKTISIWSSACSTGDEPYTAAIILKEYLKDIDDWNIEILASDINTEVLRKCEEGIYSERAVKDVPGPLLEKYFKFDGAGYILSDEIKKMVTLRRINLFNSNEVTRTRDIDVLFCRNVLIYFNDASKKRVINNFYNILHKNGFVLLGVGEFLGRISASFKLVRLDNIIVYKKEL